jgi:rubrerythrin
MATPNASDKSVTIGNLEAAFAGESMAHIKYRYFAKLAREAGAEDMARIFEKPPIRK